MRTKPIYFLYRLLQSLCAPAVLLYFLWRCVRRPAYRKTLGERLGFLRYREAQPGCIWLHAVSVGEVLSALPLIRDLRQQVPEAPVYVSVGTLAGKLVADEKLFSLTAGIFNAPIDYVFAVRRVLRGLKPSVLVVMETEIWPNLFREAARSRCAVILANGRISDKTVRRYALLRWFFFAALRWPRLILAQSEEMRRRFIRIGAPAARVIAAGNLKYGFDAVEAAPDSPVRQWMEARAPHVWIAASTSADEEAEEEDFVIKAIEGEEESAGGWSVVIAPRKPERFERVAARLNAAGIAFVRRTEMAVTTPANSSGAAPRDSQHSADAARVLLLDTIGELSGLFPFAAAVFMGGSLVRRGGHNILEPAFFGIPVVFGPYMENFRDIADDFLDQQAARQVFGPHQLGSAIRAAAADRKMGERARQCAVARRGAVDRVSAEIVAAWKTSYPHLPPSLWKRLTLGPLSSIWSIASLIHQRRLRARRQSLEAAVISIGNVTVGGTGKSPMVLLLADYLKRRGLRPGILTRGYGRKAPGGEGIFPAGARVGVRHSGDEPQLFLRAGVANLGVGKDRLAVGRKLEQLYRPGALILDDGFQHQQLARCLDVVMIDALDPFGHFATVPLGRLREPLSALHRAGVFVITRCESGRAIDAIEHLLHQLNEKAPVFRSRVKPLRFVRIGDGADQVKAEFPENPETARLEDNAEPTLAQPNLAQPPSDIQPRTETSLLEPQALAQKKALAFCGIGNPQAFLKTLEDQGIHPVDCVRFGDHHSYTPGDLRRIAKHAASLGAEALVTTEKDMINLSEEPDVVVAPLELYYLPITVEIESEVEFFELIDRIIVKHNRKKQLNSGLAEAIRPG